MIYIYPTDTVWGIGASIHSQEEHLEVHRIKGSDPEKPLSIIFKSFEQYVEYIKLPNKISKEWLQNLFLKEATLCLPISCIIEEKIPKWVYSDSQFIGTRLLNESWMQDICQEGPITTTSLNSKGQSPIVDFKEAKEFKNKYIPTGKFIETSNKKLSGSSSTIISLTDGNQVTVLRKGDLLNEVIKHCELLST